MSDIDAALGRALDAEWKVTMGDKSKRRIKTCKEFLAMARSRFDLPTEHDWTALWSQGARCFALDALRSAKTPLRSYLTWFEFKPDDIAKLPPRLALLTAPDDLDDVTKAEKACNSWSQYDASLKVRREGVDRARLRSDGWTGRLVLYARADFDGDDVEDLLIRRDGHASGGTAADSTVFVVTQTAAKACPRVVRALGPGSATGAGEAR